MTASVRPPIVAGQFYAADPGQLRAHLEACFAHRLGPGELPTPRADGPGKVIGLMVPHAGYDYSGPAMAWAYARLAADGAPARVLLLGPNHRTAGPQAALSPDSAWETPFGEVQVDAELRAELLAGGRGLLEDRAAHRWEHSLEVQLPFLQLVFGSPLRFCPLTLGGLPASGIMELGEVIARAARAQPTVLVATTDMSHYVPQQEAQRLDRLALEQVLALAPQELLVTVRQRGITMCGVAPVAVMLWAARALGAERAELLSYYTSGDIAGEQDPMERVVGYASAAVLKAPEAALCGLT